MTGTSHVETRSGQAQDGMLRDNKIESVDVSSPGLPEGVWRDRFLETIIEAYREVLTPSDQCVLRFYASQTRPADWSRPGIGPICYVGQMNAAERLRLNRKSVYNAERHLEALGLIEKTTLGNGHRRGPRGLRVESLPLGICFAPAIARYAEIAAKVEASIILRETLQAARYRVSGLRTKLRVMLRDVTCRDAVVDAMRAKLDALPSRIARIADVEPLEKLECEFQAMIDDLVDHVENMETPARRNVEPAQSERIPHKGGDHSPNHNYTTTNASPVDCTADQRDRTLDDVPEYALNGPAIAGNTPAEKPTPSAVPVNWTFAQIREAATDVFWSCIDICSEGQSTVTSETIVNAAADMAAILGINRSAWVDACAVMGRFEAALAVLVLDRNRTHPTHPVRSPGGALRAITERARSGVLNIDASIFAILRRADQAHQHHSLHGYGAGTAGPSP